MKVLIEVDLPESQSIPTANDIKRLTSPDWMCVWWHIDDVKECVDYDLTDEQAREVLEMSEKYHDPNYGLNWNAFQVYADQIKTEEEEKNEGS
jgi:hypothetical protein